MSDETKAALEAAMAAHFDDEMDGAIMTGYWLVSCGADFDRPDSTAYHYTGPNTQGFHASLGLNEMGAKYLDAQYRGDL